MRLFDLKSTFVKRLIELRKAPNGKFLDLSKSSFTFSNKNSFEKIYRENNGFRFIKKTDQNSQNCKLNIEKNASLPQVFDKNFIYLNPKKLNGEFKLRNWQKGDRIKPIGVNGSKLVSDVLKDAKVPLAVRSNQLIVHDANKVLWVVGHCVSREGIADSNQPIWKVSVDTKLDSLTLLL